MVWVEWRKRWGEFIKVFEKSLLPKALTIGQSLAENALHVEKIGVIKKEADKQEY